MISKPDWSALTPGEKALWGRAFKEGWEAGQLEARELTSRDAMADFWLVVITFILGSVTGALAVAIWLAVSV